MGAKGDSMSEHSVEVAAFDMPEEAHLARIQLAQHGIPAFVSDECVAPLYVLPGVAGFKVRVRESDHELALSILEGPPDADRDEDPDLEPIAVDPEAEPVSEAASASDFVGGPPPLPDPTVPPCPGCASTEISSETYLSRPEWLAFLFGWIAHFATPLKPRRRWVCLDCGRRFKTSESTDSPTTTGEPDADA